MATSQPLKGSTTKQYDVISNFNKGIDRKTADDVSIDSTFQNLTNFYPREEGALSKRPAVYNSNFKAFIKAIVEDNYNEKFNIVTNKFNEEKATIKTKLKEFYDTILCGVKKQIKHSTLNPEQYRTFQLDKIIGFQIINNEKFLEALQDYQTILNGEYSTILSSSYTEFSFILVGGGFTTIINSSDMTKELDKLCGFYIARFNISMRYIVNQGYEVKIEIDEVDPSISASEKRRWLYYPENYTFTDDTYIQETDEYKPLGPIDIASYNGYSYIPSGKNYFIKIDQTPDTRGTHSTYTNEADFFKIIGGDEYENLYKPTAVELMRIGFNILAKDPLTYYDVGTGSVGKTKGIFFSVEKTHKGTTFKQPVTDVPYNSEFFVHILYTGNNAPSKIEYRQNTGETDTEKNPYKNLPGNWSDDTKKIWKCTGVDSDQQFELKITLGDDTFISYFKTSSNAVDETGYISEIADLIFSSTRMTVINNQLVLYGRHGYLFFSEYDMFNYFPNYYYVYIANEAGEESVTGINYFRQYYAIFTNKRIKRMTGAFGADDFGIYPLNNFVGCPNGYTIRAVENNLMFLGNDGIYKLKQGYLGEGTENVEKMDDVLGNTLNLNNVLQAFTMGGNYVVVKNDGSTWVIYNIETQAFYEYSIESSSGQLYNGDEIDNTVGYQYLPFYSIFETNLYDSHGDFFIVPMYSYNYNSEYTGATFEGMDLMLYRFSDLNFLEENKRYKDGEGFVSSLETHYLNMGYPTNTKKFKELYIKMYNKTGHIIPLYIKIWVDDKVVISPDDYIIMKDPITNTYYYTLKAESNYKLDNTKVIGELILGSDVLGEKTIQQIKIKVREKGRAIKIKLSDGFNDTTKLVTSSTDKRGLPVRNRNIHDFSISTIGIVYKIKKVKEG